MVTATIIIICIITVLLILIVLVQNSKGGGLSGELGGLGSNQLMGVKKTTDLLEQITWGLGVGMMVLTLASYIMIDKSSVGTQSSSVNVDRAATRTVPAAGPAAAPAGAPAPAQQTPAAAPAGTGATPPPAAAPSSATK
ncbi:preprotein translocase subunit SecG [Arsenicibacter rosenii]|uniref:Protein-export membrane protein SecG n=1 Tax=Arsenicibacter rosenii TaxID=1750698 RepID=A0A1S2VQN4_9BACT|nr:preprotein translocase subunit SecG [Arsenicibacter rosenii]OIN61097.1 preprotein translocase subunit SecG [Arsenicibacter rosenii]